MHRLLIVALVGCASAPPRGFHEVTDPSVPQVVTGVIVSALGFAIAAKMAPRGSGDSCCDGNALVSTPAALAGIAGAALAIHGLSRTRLEVDGSR